MNFIIPCTHPNYKILLVTMPTPPILPIIKDFLDRGPYSALEITFATHNVHCYHQGNPFNQVQKHQSRILINRARPNGLAEMLVADNLVFSFSFQFKLPDTPAYHSGAMLHLPRPLDQGRLEIGAEKLHLSFRINAPNPDHRVHISQTYKGIQHLEKFCSQH